MKNSKDWSISELEMFIFGYCYGKAQEFKEKGHFPDFNVNELANYLMKGGVMNIYNRLKENGL